MKMAGHCPAIFFAPRHPFAEDGRRNQDLQLVSGLQDRVTNLAMTTQHPNRPLLEHPVQHIHHHLRGGLHQHHVGASNAPVVTVIARQAIEQRLRGHLLGNPGR